MAKKLQEKEIFIPLSGGADTEADPRLPRASTMVTENADFSIPGVVRKREPLATLGGDASTDDPVGLAVNLVRTMGPSADGKNVLLVGGSTQETGSPGKYSSSSYGGTVGESTRVSGSSVLDIPVDDVAYADIAVHNGDDEQQYVVLVNTVAYVVGKTSGAPVANVDSSSVYARSNAAYSVYSNSTSGNFEHYSWDGSSWGSQTPIAVTHTPDGPMLSFSNSATHTICVGLNSNTNVVGTLVNVSSGAELDFDQQNNTATGTFSCFAACEESMTDTSGDIFVAALESVGADTVLHAGVFEWSGDTLSLANAATKTFSASDPVSVAINTVESTNGIIVLTVKDADELPVTYGYRYTPGSGLYATTNSVLYGVEVNSGAVSTNTVRGTYDVYCVLKREGGRHWHTTNTAYDLNSPQNDLFMAGFSKIGIQARYTSFFHQIGRRHSNNDQIVSPVRSYYDESAQGMRILAPIPIPARVVNSVNIGTNVAGFDINFDVQYDQMVTYGDYVMVPGGYPKVYDGVTLLPMGVTDYPDGIVATNANSAGGDFTNAGGAGTYYYSATYTYQDNLGNEHESAPSPSVGVTFTNVNTNVSVNVTVPPTYYPSTKGLDEDAGVRTCKINLYRTSESGNDFFLIDTAQKTSAFESEYTFTDTGSVGFSTTSGLDTLYTAKALYTLNGDLANTPVRQHRASCTHLDRYCYADEARDETDVYYSKAPVVGIAPEFSDVLRVVYGKSGGSIRSLVSAWDKLFAFKDRAIYVTYGQPLNNAGAGQGFASPRLVTREYGASKQRAAAQGSQGIFFINSLDGLIYVLSENEGIAYIGGPVRHYCESYAYDNVWFNPRNHAVRFSSIDDGAPVLSYDYKYKRWTTLTGRYTAGFGGTKFAFAAPAGSTYGFGDKVVDITLDGSNRLYIQDPIGTYGTVESYDLSVDTQWISLSDIAGYGKFYKWTLVGGKPGTNCNVIAKTAYAYEPYWSDSVEINATSSVFTSPLSDHFGTMTNANAVDASFKWEFDGSRHKTDAVRIQIATNNGTERDNIELVGIRCRIGVKPGAYRLGDSRHTD